MGFLDKLRASVARKPAPAPAPEPAPAPVAVPPRPAPVAKAPAPAARPAAAPARPAGTAPASKFPFLAPSKPPAGPLRLATGDFVTHYRDRFAVTGVRVLENGKTTVLHYCLRDAKGAAAVIACRGGNDPSLTLERALTDKLWWDADEIAGVADEPLRLVATAKVRVRSWGDCGHPATVKTAECRAYSDASGDQTLALEDYEGRREARRGDPVHEGEMEFERAGASAGTRTAALGDAAKFEDASPDDIAKGTPRAAAKALEESLGKSKLPLAAPDQDPTAYDDDTWADAVDDQPLPTPVRAKVTKKSQTIEDEDEWVSATQLVRQNGEVGGDDDEYDEQRAAQA